MAGGMHGRGACMAGGHVGQEGGMSGGGGCMAHMPLSLQILQDTVNEWVVCILLECILVHWEILKEWIKNIP